MDPDQDLILNLDPYYFSKNWKRFRKKTIFTYKKITSVADRKSRNYIASRARSHNYELWLRLPILTIL